jgi:hypothetical protein
MLGWNYTCSWCVAINSHIELIMHNEVMQDMDLNDLGMCIARIFTGEVVTAWACTALVYLALA